MARSVLRELGASGGWACSAPTRAKSGSAPDIDLDVDLDAHEQALRAALRSRRARTGLGAGRRPLEREESRSKTSRRPSGPPGYANGSSTCARRPAWSWPATALGAWAVPIPEEVLEAWQACLEADSDLTKRPPRPSCGCTLAQGRRPQAIAVYERCAAALAALGLKTSPVLEELRASVDYAARPAARPRRLAKEPRPPAAERSAGY